MFSPQKIPPKHSDVVERTIDSYNEHADAFLRKHGSFEPIEALMLLQKYIKNGAKILDAGCGVGRDTDYLIRHGYPATIGLDMSLGMLLAGISTGGFNFPAVVGDFRCLPLQSKQFDVIWAAASLIHVPRSQIVDTLIEFQRVLVKGGIVYFNLIRGRGEYGEDSPPGEWDRGWRYFVFFEEEEIKSLLKQLNWELLQFWERSSANRNPQKGTVRDFFHVIARAS